MNRNFLSFYNRFISVFIANILIIIFIFTSCSKQDSTRFEIVLGTVCAVTLFDNKNENGGFPTQYFVAENMLIQLDMDVNKITGIHADSYVLKKSDVGASLTGTYWKLIEINGQAVTAESGNANEPHIIFDADENRVFGSAGCNTFRGVFELGHGDRLSFPKPMAVTMMMCINMNTEDQFLRMFENVDSYAIQGDILSLHRARMAPLARFVAVEK